MNRQVEEVRENLNEMYDDAVLDPLIVILATHGEEKFVGFVRAVFKVVEPHDKWTAVSEKLKNLYDDKIVTS